MIFIDLGSSVYCAREIFARSKKKKIIIIVIIEGEKTEYKNECAGMCVQGTTMLYT